jgi:acetyl-CoA/propionyl-CoA carboxylase biotin carboxyl carrier protein
MPTVVPFDRVVLDDPAFAATSGTFGVHTRWIETEFDNTIEPWQGTAADAEPGAERERVVVEVGGRRLEVVLPAGLGAGRAAGSNGGAGGVRKPARRKAAAAAAPSGDALTSPMQGTIVKVAVADGDQVEAGDLVVVLEAMKMEQPLTAHRSGTVRGLAAELGATVTSGSVLCEIVDA